MELVVKSHLSSWKKIIRIWARIHLYWIEQESRRAGHPLVELENRLWARVLFVELVLVVKSKFEPAQSHLSRLVKSLTRQIPNWCSFDLLRLLKDNTKALNLTEITQPALEITNQGQTKSKPGSRGHCDTCIGSSSFVNPPTNSNPAEKNTISIYFLF